MELDLQELCGVDVVGRYGGEEFAALLPQTSLEERWLVAERLRRAMSDHLFQWNGD